MEALKPVELKLLELFKKLPPLPESARKWLAEYIWVIALIGVVFGAVSAFLLMTGVLFVTPVTYPSNIYVTAAPEIKHSFALAWIALVALVVYIVILGLAVPKLKVRAKAGWNLLFLGSLLFFVYDIFNWLQYPRAFGGFVWNVLMTAVGLYFLFQIRDRFSTTTPVNKK